MRGMFWDWNSRRLKRLAVIFYIFSSHMSWIICLVSFSRVSRGTQQLKKNFLRLPKEKMLETRKVERQQRKIEKERIKLSRHSTLYTHSWVEWSWVKFSFTLHLSSVSVSHSTEDVEVDWNDDDNEQHRRAETKGKCCNSTICHFWWIANVYLEAAKAGNTNLRRAKRAWIIR